MPFFSGELPVPARRLAALAGVCCLLLGSCDRLKPAAPPKLAPLPEIVAESAPAPAPPEVVIDPAVPELTINKSAQVSVLGYHEFVLGKPKQDMQINIDHFREQMQALKDARLAVITMADFLAWRRGEKDIPDPSVVITMDDGWKSVYQLALPVLKEFGYPFTIFLYKNYVNGGGRALTTSEIRELMANGAEVGSHSVSHKVAAALRQEKNRGPASYEAFVRSEMQVSKQFLRDLTGTPVSTYAYPGGLNTELDRKFGLEAGYEGLFTVNPGRVTWDTPSTSLPRYIIYGKDPKDANFRRAISSRGTSEGDMVKALLGGPAGEALVSTTPKPDATVADRLPLIEVDVSRLQDIDPASVKMKIAGFGTVPAEFDQAGGRIRYRLKEALRSNDCQVFVTFKRATEPKPDAVNWRFAVDLVAHYLPEPPPVLEPAIPGETMASPEEPSTEAAASAPIPSSAPAPVPLPGSR
ncbi:MAG: polysaccharide deacetylase family protein [Verrucomicrobiota bacterium]